jgi:DNA replication protein DnaC
MKTSMFGQRYAGSTMANTVLNPEHSQKVLDWLKECKNFLLLMGKPGCGKTYVCSAIMDYCYGKVSDVYAMREGELFERLRRTMDLKGDYRQEIEYQLDHGLFILDDIGSSGEGQTGWRKEVLFEAIALRYESQKPTVFSTNYDRSDIKSKLGERAYSRLFASENTIIDMFTYPDLRIS